MKTPPELDKIADVCLNYRPKNKAKMAKPPKIHRIDITSCDEVTIEGPADRISISDGKFQVYGFKKYGIDWKMECQINR